MPYVKNHIRVEVPHRSGFDKTHRHSGSITCGTITPILCDEVIPNTRISLRLPINIQLPPLVSDTYMNLKAKVEAFFCPSRILCKSFEDFFCDFPKRVGTYASGGSGGSSVTFSDVVPALPVFDMTAIANTSGNNVVTKGTLLDFLGLKLPTGSSSVAQLRINPLPLIAYHLVYQEWYRNPRVQNPCFVDDLGAMSSDYAADRLRISSLPYKYFHRDFTGAGGTSFADNTLIQVSSANIGNFVLADGISVFSLRQRNFGLDYFTGSRVNAQQGSPASVSFTVPITGTDDGTGNVTGSGTGSISIAQLRAQNSLQQFRERNNIPSPRMVDQVRARYNANLSDGVAQRPICIGSASYDVFSRGVDQTSDSNDTVSTPENLFSGVGAQYGRAAANGSDFIINDFVANEPGYILVNLTLVPEASYAYGADRMFTRYLTAGSITDMASPILQNVGDQPIMEGELTGVLFGSAANVFGYQDRYADWMFKPSRTSAELREDGTLKQFVLQRAIVGRPSLSSAFLQIPKNYLDGVTTVAVATSGVSAWFDAMLEYKVSMPLAEFSIPSLQDPAYEHGESVVLRRNGQIF